MEIIWEEPWFQKSPSFWRAKDVSGCQFSARLTEGEWSWRVRAPGVRTPIAEGRAKTADAARDSAARCFLRVVTKHLDDPIWEMTPKGTWCARDDQLRLLVRRTGDRWHWRVDEVLSGLDEDDAPNPHASTSTLFEGHHDSVETAKHAAVISHTLLLANILTR